MTADRSIPGGWRWVRFGDVVRQVRDRVDPETAGLERYVAGEHMDTDDLHIRRWGDVGEGYLGPAFHMRFRPGQVLYGSRRTYLRKVAVPDFEGICANTTFVIESSTDDLLPEFLPLVMTTEAFHEHSIKQSKGSVNPYINFKDLTWYEFALPPIGDQEQFADMVAAVESVLEAYAGVAELLSRARLSHLRAAGARGAERSLKELVTAIEAGKSPPAADRHPEEGEVGVLKVSAVRDGWFDRGEVKTVLGDQGMGPSTLVRAGDVLVTRANTSERVGWACLVDEPLERTHLSDKTLRLIPNATVISSRVLVESLRLGSVRRQIEDLATGSSASMKNISQKKLLTVRVEVPNLEDQERLHQVLERLDTLGRGLRDVSLNLKALRQSLLSTVLAGAS